MKEADESVLVREDDGTTEEARELREIARDVEDIKSTVVGSRLSSLRAGLYQGAGFVVGGALAVVLFGWILSLVGVIPGFGEIASELKEIIQEQRR